MGCNHSCSSCSAGCGDTNSLQKPLNALSSVKHVIGVMSGKGGVGKSMTTALMACEAARQGLKVALLDADITGPSAPKAFGLHHRLVMEEHDLIVPAQTKALGISVVSMNLLLAQEDMPVLYRGPIVGQTVTQLWQETLWQDIDVMFIDMPPGTGDVTLTVFQSIPLDGIVLMTAPQDLVQMIVGKAVHMAQMMDVPMLGVIENYSYFACPDCGARHSVFGESQTAAAAEHYGLAVLAHLPIDPRLATAMDHGNIEQAQVPEELQQATLDLLEKVGAK